MRKLIVLVVATLLFSFAPSTVSVQQKGGRIKNVVLLIGDGMGLSQISAGLYMNNNRLALERFRVVGLHKSYSADNLVTDSAAGATAFSCGKKTYNSAIGVDMAKKPIKTILEMAEERGMATGLVATCGITHATPAAFIAHQEDRDMHEEIAADFLKTSIDLFIGGGRKYFETRKDKRNLVDELRNKNYYISDSAKDQIQNLNPKSAQNIACFTATSDPRKAGEGRTYLPDATGFALEFLKGKSKAKGFFLMVEGSQIDWGGHANDSEYIIQEMIDFDNAVAQALDFAEKDGETLVIVTADHETGGYALNPGSKMGKIEAGFTSKKHTAVLIPVFAFGKGAETFGGIYENTAIFDKMKIALGF